MIKFLFLLPIVLCIIWAAYLRFNNFELAQGKKGFIHILIFSAVIAAFYTLLIWVTH